MNNKNLILWLGIILVLVGLLGFVNNPVLSLFQVNGAHNLVHILTGVLGIVFAMMGDSPARAFAKVFGYVYALVFILGLFVGTGMLLGFIAINPADNILHLLLAIAFFVLGYMAIGEKKMDSMPAR